MPLPSPSRAPCLTDLPNELALHIIGDLGLGAFLAMRQCCKWTEGLCSTPSYRSQLKQAIKNDNPTPDDQKLGGASLALVLTLEVYLDEYPPDSDTATIFGINLSKLLYIRSHPDNGLQVSKRHLDYAAECLHLVYDHINRRDDAQHWLFRTFTPLLNILERYGIHRDWRATAKLVCKAFTVIQTCRFPLAQSGDTPLCHPRLVHDHMLRLLQDVSHIFFSNFRFRQAEDFLKSFVAVLNDQSCLSRFLFMEATECLKQCDKLQGHVDEGKQLAERHVEGFPDQDCAAKLHSALFRSPHPVEQFSNERVLIYLAQYYLHQKFYDEGVQVGSVALNELEGSDPADTMWQDWHEYLVHSLAMDGKIKEARRSCGQIC